MDINGEVFTKIALEIFKVSGLLNIEGDKITEEFGLSSARWKVMGAIEKSNTLLTVSQIGRTMGQSRQATQRVADLMVKGGLLTWLDNPGHKKAKLVDLTDKGKQVYCLLDNKQEKWAALGVEGITREELDKTLITLNKMAKFLERDRVK
jgi:DNA-binding MarR family transcriptional regulator